MTATQASEPTRSLADRLEHESQIQVADCYQCGKCSAGCPVAAEMDHAPSRILRMLQLELPQHEEPILRSRTPWLCVGCETCLTRCPQDVDLPRVMDFIRQEALARGIAHRDAAAVVAFHRAFLQYKLRSRHFFQDLTVAPAMFLKGKVGLLPHGPRDSAVTRLFARVREREKKKGSR
jgi:heterodisulfide reductase subunit C